MQNGAALGSTPKASIAHDQPVRLTYTLLASCSVLES